MALSFLSIGLLIHTQVGAVCPVGVLGSGVADLGLLRFKVSGVHVGEAALVLPRLWTGPINARLCIDHVVVWLEMPFEGSSKSGLLTLGSLRRLLCRLLLGGGGIFTWVSS